MKPLLLLLCATLALSAQEPVADAIKALKASPPTADTLASAVPLLADPTGRSSVRGAILALDPFPSEELTGLLSHADLAVRLGALELLEEKAGGDFGFNPWATPDSPENEGPLARWKQWAGEAPGTAPKKDLFGDEQRRSYLHDLLGNDADKSARSRRMLEADGLGAVGFLEAFLSNSPTLPTGSRAKVREAQYQIVLSRPLGPQAASTARQLAFGSRDQTLAALGTLRGAGLVALPILRDFLQHADPLVRETAIDAMLSAGGAQSLPVIGPVLVAETDVNVIHGALRRLKEIPGDASLKLASSFLAHADEDLLVSAIQACLKLAGGSEDDFMFSGSGRKPKVAEGVQAEVNQEILKALADPRWRVRTAALEFVAGRKVAEAKERCVELLSDPDDFVRFSAIKASAALGAEGAAAKLKEMFLADAGMVGPVLEGYAALSRSPDAEMVEKLGSYPPDARLAAIRAAEADSDLSDIVMRFANDPDLDVSCAAIRFLSSSADRVKTTEVASVLVSALRSDSPEKRAAALDRLALPPSTNKQIDPALQQAMSVLPRGGEKTTLDPLYDAFIKAAGQQVKAPAAKVDVIPGAQGELIKALNVIATDSSEHSFRAALCLARAGDPGGLLILSRQLPQLSTAQRAAIAEQLYEPTRKEALDLLRQLLRDPIEEIRSAAAGSTLSNDDSPAFLSMLLEELASPESKLQPSEVYDYQFESVSRQSKLQPTLRAWALSVIRDEKSPTPLGVLALISLRQSFPASASEPVLALAKGSPDRWIRRAAWHAMGNNGTATFRQNLALLAEDPSPHVRAVLPEVSGRMSAAWMHRFDDTRSKNDSSWSYERQSRRLTAESKAALEKMAATDPDECVRFEAMFALLSQSQTIDVAAFAAMIPRQPEEVAASFRVANWMAENSTRLGAGLAPVVAALDTTKVQPDKMQDILARIAPKDEGGGFASFSALVAGAEATAAAPQQTEEEDDAGEEKPVRETLKVIYFYKPGCAECDKASQLLETVKADFPLLQVERHNINETDGTLLNQALCSRFQVPSNKHTIAPAIFSQTGFLIREDILPQALGGLLSTTMSKAQDDAWSIIAKPEMAAAQEVVQEKFQALTLPVVLLAGLIDGINPCAFATIIFFLSYLQIARRTPREMLMVGAAFITAVFLAYFLAGLVLHKVLAQVTEHIAGIKPWLDWIFGGLALVAALLSFRDAMKARAGKIDEMSLQLPGFLKDRIRGVIRTGARARRFVIGAFLAGLAISFLELACTGQVYAPIIYHIQQGRMDAVAWLLAYNLAFIVPLIVIFGLAFTGMTSNALIAFQTKHTFAVKIALGLVFVALAWVIIFGQKMLHA
ncbi:HEAT repeat domain-containing protein [Luteolibacter flavescens]|uniref:HEAT repeat domain-containing protein n=1 Tax=Luteolibacter flavescens TaxID=1859460 RepID=A0ABT3FQ36_9BACT|nr:HEAT repeat domain-containing protein [Luteolibacter flavescens]MCW1885690.1 HEAT repeat domain-containing protein [Luteolibacter flavescens]